MPQPEQSHTNFQLAKHRISNNVGSVKHFLSELRRALEQERHFALVEDVPYQPRLARNPGSDLDSVRPMHLFDPLPRS
jgi:UDP-N-acetylglucosamine 2-epimerase